MKNTQLVILPLYFDGSLTNIGDLKYDPIVRKILCEVGIALNPKAGKRTEKGDEPMFALSCAYFKSWTTNKDGYPRKYNQTEARAMAYITATVIYNYDALLYEANRALLFAELCMRGI